MATLRSRPYRRFGKSHPEWFAQGRTFESRMQLCFTHPELIQQAVQDARDFFDGKGLKYGAFGMGDYFSLVPNDNWKAWCQCERCRAMLKDTEYTDNRLVSNYWFTFVNRVAREVAKTHPDKWISTLAYHYYSYPPKDFALEPNVSIQICLGPRALPSREQQEGDQRKLDFWAAESPQRPKYVWLWYCYPYLWHQPFPGFIGNHVPQIIERYLQAGVRGIYYEPSVLRTPHHTVSHFLMDQVEFYMTWRLADDPHQNGAEMLGEFFTRYYGPAAGRPMRQMYDLMEQIFAAGEGYAFTDEFVYTQLATEKNMARLAELMQQAVTAEGTELERKRVKVFEQGIWQPLVAGRKAYVEKLPELKRQAERAATTVPPMVEAPRLSVTPDGDLAQVDWKASMKLEGFRSLVGEDTKRGLRAAVAHDGTYLYLRLNEALDPAKLVVNGSVWGEDNWEIFIGPARKRPYYQLGVNSAGKYSAYKYPEEEEQQPWHSTPKVVSKVSESEGWTLMLALPLEGLLPERADRRVADPGSSIVYFNAIRGSGNGITGALAWSPTFAGFHVPERMGTIRLGLTSH